MVRSSKVDDRWMRDALVTLNGAIEKFKRGNEGDFKQALMIADHATETIMRNYLIFKCNENPPYDYPSLLQNVCKKTKVEQDIVEIIEMFRLVRDGFSHQNIKKNRKRIERNYFRSYIRKKLFGRLSKSGM